jgi:FkbM family methyltransferase
MTGVRAVWRKVAGLGSSVRRATRASRAIEGRARFIARESRKKPEMGRYRLREFDGRVLVRHDNLDAWTLDEIFVLKTYQPPAAPQSLLEALPRRRALDLGGNVGMFAVFAHTALGCATGTIFEPDPTNRRVLAETLRVNALTEWLAVGGCAGTASGTVSFVAVGSPLSKLGDGPGGIQVPVFDVLPVMREHDIAKIDIEGAEWEILCDPRFPSFGPSVMVVEYHPEGCPDADPRRFLSGLFKRAGYSTSEVEFPDRVAMPYQQGVMWAWRDYPGR